MTKIAALIALSLPSVACLIGAAVMAYRGTAGWGWLIFAGLIICPLTNPNICERLINAAAEHPQ